MHCDLSLFPHPLCGWCAYILSLLAVLVGPLFVLGFPGGPSTAADPGGPAGPLPKLFGPVLGDPGRPLVLCPLNLTVFCGSVDELVSPRWL